MSTRVCHALKYLPSCFFGQFRAWVISATFSHSDGQVSVLFSISCHTNGPFSQVDLTPVTSALRNNRDLCFFRMLADFGDMRSRLGAGHFRLS